MKKQTLSNAIKQLDIVYSKWLRLSCADKNGNVQCFTCPKIDNWKNMDCGHYISRQYKNTRWLRQNTEIQCPACNRFHEGRKDVFALNLQKKYGDDILAKLSIVKDSLRKCTIPEINELKEHYKNEIKNMEGK